MEIVNHQKKRINWYILHTATVRTEEPMMIDFKPDVEILAVNAAIKAGYHPAGFDLRINLTQLFGNKSSEL